MTQTVKHNINPILHLSLNVSQCLKEKDITTHFWYDIMYLIVTKSCKVELAVLFLTFFFLNFITITYTCKKDLDMQTE